MASLLPKVTGTRAGFLFWSIIPGVLPSSVWYKTAIDFCYFSGVITELQEMTVLPKCLQKVVPKLPSLSHWHENPLGCMLTYTSWNLLQTVCI